LWIGWLGLVLVLKGLALFSASAEMLRTDSTAHLYYILTKPQLLLYMKVRPDVVVAQRSFDSWLFSFAVDVGSQLPAIFSLFQHKARRTSDL
jgi:hypothetical protein